MNLKRIPLLIPALLWMLLSSCTISHMLVHNFSDIRDYKRFPSRPLKASPDAFRFTPGDPATLAGLDLRITHDGRRRYMDSLLEESKTVAFLIIRNDSMLYENYFRRYTADSWVASFSMAKSYTSALLGIALEEGKVHSVDDSITTYLTELRGKGLQNITIRNLLQMTAGLDHKENYFNPFAGVAKLYYGHNLRTYIKHHTRPGDQPGLAFDYQSIQSQLLGMIVERATGEHLTDYLQKHIWGPAGMESDASWSTDRKKNGMEKAFAGINATARDFAKFGRLYMHKGNWNGKQLVPGHWVEESTKVDASHGSAWYYQYQWWLPSKEGDFYAAGHLGQFIYVYPAKNLIIVRLGKKSGGVNWPVAFRELALRL